MSPLGIRHFDGVRLLESRLALLQPPRVHVFECLQRESAVKPGRCTTYYSTVLRPCHNVGISLRYLWNACLGITRLRLHGYVRMHEQIVWLVCETIQAFEMSISTFRHLCRDDGI